MNNALLYFQKYTSCSFEAITDNLDYILLLG